MLSRVCGNSIASLIDSYRPGQACLSVHRALLPRFGSPGFTVDDLTGADCLHPLNGRHGNTPQPTHAPRRSTDRPNPTQAWTILVRYSATGLTA